MADRANAPEDLDGLRRDNEALRRQLDIEAALERVRVTALAMQQSDDLVEVSGVLFDEFAAMGIEPVRSSITTWDESKEIVWSWATRIISSRSIVYEESFEEYFGGFAVYREGFEAWKRGEPYHVKQYAEAERDAHLRVVQSYYRALLAASAVGEGTEMTVVLPAQA